MGLCQSNDAYDPATIAGSTVINSRNVMILDGKCLIPAMDTVSGDSSVIEVDMKQRRVHIIRGVSEQMTNGLIRSTRRNKKYKKAFAKVSSTTL
jgi:hypothetical protein